MGERQPYAQSDTIDGLTRLPAQPTEPYCFFCAAGCSNPLG